MITLNVMSGSRYTCSLKPLLFFVLYCFALGYPVHAQPDSPPTSTSEDLLHHFDQLLPVIENELLETLREISFDPSVHPSYTDNKSGNWVTTNEFEWTSGFFSGMLWQLFELTGKEQWSGYALQWTKSLEPVKSYRSDHDTGFRIMPGFGRGYDLTENLAYLQVIRHAAGTLSGRYRQSLGVIRSWDWTPPYIQWNYPVIIDNIMNLELLFKAGEKTNNREFYNIAYRHASTTLKNHFRDDGSIFHIVDYADDGSVQWKGTVQGYSNDSVWARGQSWAIYGFVMAYRYTREPSFLEASEFAAEYFINHLPEDGIPYYDFLDPSIPNTAKDVSAAAVAASALLELYEFTGKAHYLEISEKMLYTMSNPPYFDPAGKHSSLLSMGARQKGDSGTGLVYADYYFLEAWMRYMKIQNIRLPELKIPHINYLGQNYPNPFRSFTTIPYTIQTEGQVQIRLFELSGKFIRTLFINHQTPGSYLQPVTLSGLATGVYLYELVTPEERLQKKLVFIR